MGRDLIDNATWELIAAFLPPERRQRGRPAIDNRRVLEGIVRIARTGAPWRDLPERFGHWTAVWRCFAWWRNAGPFETIREALATSGARDTALQMIDSTIARAHHCAAGTDARIRIWSSGSNPRDARGTQSQDLGRSKGGFTTKIHLRTNAAGLPMKAAVTATQASDYRGYGDTLDADLPPTEG